MLEVPSYIETAGVRGAPVDYVWESNKHYARDDAKLKGRFAGLSFRAVLALSAGVAEWVGWRLVDVTTYPTKLEFIEAVWAGVIDPRYVNRWKAGLEPSPKDGDRAEIPMFVANRLLSEAFKEFSIPTASLSLQTVYLCFLAKHVLPKSKAFDEWLSATVTRLDKRYARDSGDPMGRPVPREALDPASEMKKSDEPELLRRFLSRLEPGKNRFLRSPDELKRSGFEGTPYEV